MRWTELVVILVGLIVLAVLVAGFFLILLGVWS